MAALRPNLARTGGLSLALLLGSTWGPGAVSAQEQAIAYPTIAGNVTITAVGMKGVTLRVPALTTLPEKHFELRLHAGSFAYVGLADNAANPEGCGPSPSSGGSQMCLDIEASAIPEAGLGVVKWSPDPPYVRPGLLDIYVITDGEVTFTMIFPDLPGSLEMDATGDVTATLERLPIRCLSAESCDNVGFGGATHDVGALGATRGIAWSRIPMAFTGSQSVVACEYPTSTRSPNSSPNPEDHPYGCDFIPKDGDEAWLDHLINFTANAYRFQIQMRWAGSNDASGRRYLGYTAEQFSPVYQGGAHGAWGMWLSQGIGCPTGDFSDCQQSG